MAALPYDAEFSARRFHMVENQLRPCDVTDLAILAAFAGTPREAFVAPNATAIVYLDREAPSRGPKSRALLAPVVLARLLQAAKIQPGERALEVAGGSGYGAAIMASLGAKVESLDSDPAAITAGPYAVILVNGAFERSPDDLVGLLADGGRLVGVEAISGAPKAVLIENSAGAVSRRVLFDANASRIDEYRRAEAFVF